MAASVVSQGFYIEPAVSRPRHWGGLGGVPFLDKTVMMTFGGGRRGC